MGSSTTLTDTIQDIPIIGRSVGIPDLATLDADIALASRLTNVVEGVGIRTNAGLITNSFQTQAVTVRDLTTFTTDLTASFKSSITFNVMPVINLGISVGPFTYSAGRIETVNLPIGIPDRTFQASGNVSLSMNRAVEVSPSPLLFGQVSVGSTSAQTMTIKNPGNWPLNVTSISFPSGFTGNFSGMIQPGDSRQVTVTFSPATPGDYSGSATVNSNKTGGNSTISLSGTGVIVPTRIPRLSGGLAFGSVEVGSSSQRTLTITNDGNAALTVTGITYPGGISGNWSGTILAGGSRQVTVAFSPTAATSYSGTVTVNCNKTDGTDTISASGIGTRTATRIPRLGGDLAFGSVSVGSSAQRTMTLANDGNEALAISGITYPSGFSGAVTPGTLAPGASLSVTVTFSPTAETTYNGTVTLNSNKTNTTSTNTISASGAGTAARTVIPRLVGDLAFGNVKVGSSLERNLTIINDGNAPMRVSYINFPFGFSARWPVDLVDIARLGQVEVAPGGAVQVTVTFSPVAATSYNGTVTVNCDRTTDTNTTSVSGTGITAETRIPSLGGDVAFGSVTVGSSAQRTLTISNVGTAALAVTGITYPDGFSGNWSSGTIEAGGSQPVIVTFSPTAATSYNGTVTVNCNKTNATDTNTVPASGTGSTSQFPANDAFADATPITSSAGQVNGSNVDATKQSGEPNHAGDTGGTSVWWKWVATSTGVITVDTIGSNFDTLLAVYTGGSVGTLTAVAADDESGGDNTSALSFAAVSGTTYWIAVDGWQGAKGAIMLRLGARVGPANDFFADATQINGASARLSGSTVGATKQAGEPDHAGNPGGSSIWWTWTAPSTGTVSINTTGSRFDTLLAVYSGASSPSDLENQAWGVIFQNFSGDGRPNSDGLLSAVRSTAGGTGFCRIFALDTGLAGGFTPRRPVLVRRRADAAA